LRTTRYLQKSSFSLRPHGLELIVGVGATDYRKRYLKPAGRRLYIFEGERIAVAKVRSNADAD
jgi:hypothetical protein